MIDRQYRFSKAQAVTAAAASTDYVDLVSTKRNLGDGTPLWLVVACVVAMTDAGSDSTLAVTLETDDNTAFSSATTVQTIGTFAALSAAGTRFQQRLQPVTTPEQYIQIRYTPANGNLSTGSFDAFITTDPDRWFAYPSGFKVS